MPDSSKIFTFQQDGLSYTVTVYELNGQFFADIQVTEGAMDVNAIYIADDDIDGRSVSLGGPLNMNGAGSVYDGETVQWDDAIKISDPGLGPDGANKESYLTPGDTLTVELDITTLDEVDFFGIRATSTTTDSGSIKGVSGDPEEPEEPDDPEHDKVFFDYGTDDNGNSLGGVFILAEEPAENPFQVPSLPEGTEPTFENFVSYFEQLGGEIGSIQSVVFYEEDADGNNQVSFQIDAPEGGFASSDDLIAAYNDAVESMSGQAADPGLELMSALTTEIVPEDEPLDDEDELDAEDA